MIPRHQQPCSDFVLTVIYNRHRGESIAAYVAQLFQRVKKMTRLGYVETTRLYY